MAPPDHPSVFDRIYADVRKDVPSVAQVTLNQELFRVLDDFCDTTNIWQETVPLPIVPPNQSYTITSTQPSKINRLLLVYDTAAPTKYWPRAGIEMRVPGVITLYYPPSNSAAWAAIVAKRPYPPMDTDTGYPVIDDWIVDKYADTLGRGILARLQWEPQKPYSNPILAQTNQRAYISGRSLARADASQMNVYNGQNWRFPQGFSTVIRKPWT
jgi:hypothetical protein